MLRLIIKRVEKTILIYFCITKDEILPNFGIFLIRIVIIINWVKDWTVQWITFLKLDLYLGGVGKGKGMPTQAIWVWGGCVTFFWKMLNQKLLIKKFWNYVFLNTYAMVFEMHTISFPVYFLKVRYSLEEVWLRFKSKGNISSEFWTWIRSSNQISFVIFF